MISQWIASISHPYNPAGRWRRRLVLMQRPETLAPNCLWSSLVEPCRLELLHHSFWRCEICWEECAEACLLREGMGNLPGAFPCEVSTCVCEETVLMNDVVPANSVFLIVQIFPRAARVCAASYVRLNLDRSDRCAMVGNYLFLLKVLCSTS